jgi:hypothetical protein
MILSWVRFSQPGKTYSKKIVGFYKASQDRFSRPTKHHHCLEISLPWLRTSESKLRLHYHSIYAYQDQSSTWIYITDNNLNTWHWIFYFFRIPSKQHQNPKHLQLLKKLKHPSRPFSLTNPNRIQLLPWLINWTYQQHHHHFPKKLKHLLHLYVHYVHNPMI